MRRVASFCVSGGAVFRYYVCQPRTQTELVNRLEQPKYAL